jgi:hypothetical protein
MKLPLITLDKANHFIYGFAIYFISMAFFALLNMLPVGVAFVAFMDVVNWQFMPLATVVFFAIAKEIYDEIDYGGFDCKDILATVTPALILTLTNII